MVCVFSQAAASNGVTRTREELSLASSRVDSGVKRVHVPFVAALLYVRVVSARPAPACLPTPYLLLLTTSTSCTPPLCLLMLLLLLLLSAVVNSWR